MTDLLAVGRIGHAHGVRGEVSVQSLSEVEDRFRPGSTLSLEDGRTLTVSSSRPHQQRLLVKFEEVPDRDAAEALRGEVLLVDPRDRPAAPEGAFWVHEVVGLEVVTEDGRSLGPIAEVRGNPANDLWILEDGTMIPAVRQVVLSVDLSAGRVTIRELPGLVAD